MSVRRCFSSIYDWEFYPNQSIVISCSYTQHNLCHCWEIVWLHRLPVREMFFLCISGGGLCTEEWIVYHLLNNLTKTRHANMQSCLSHLFRDFLEHTTRPDSNVCFTGNPDTNLLSVIYRKHSHKNQTHVNLVLSMTYYFVYNTT